MKLYCLNPQMSLIAQVRVIGIMTGQKVQYVTVDKAVKDSAEFKAMNTDKLPVLKTAEGTLHESTAICKYFCALADNNFLGTNTVQRSQVDQWIAFNNSTIMPPAYKVYQGIFGWGEITKPAWTDALNALKKNLDILNTALEGKKWLLGDELSIADIILSTSLLYAFQTALDGGFLKNKCKNLERWASECYKLPEMVMVHGIVKMCNKACQPFCVAEQKKEEPKKKQAQQPAKPKEEAPKKEEKPKDNVQSLPPTSFDLFNFKTFFVNHPDKKGEAVDQMYKDLDWDGWSFWRFEYDILPDEGKKEHITNNLMNGFLSRAEHTSKYTFARHCVLGEEPELKIIGVWLCRGPKEIPDGLTKEHAQFEYYKTRQLDPRNNPDDDKLIRGYWGGQPGDVIDGTLKAVTMKWHK